MRVSNKKEVMRDYLDGYQDNLDRIIEHLKRAILLLEDSMDSIKKYESDKKNPITNITSTEVAKHVIQLSLAEVEYIKKMFNFDKEEGGNE